MGDLNRLEGQSGGWGTGWLSSWSFQEEPKSVPVSCEIVADLTEADLRCALAANVGIVEQAAEQIINAHRTKTNTSMLLTEKDQAVLEAHRAGICFRLPNNGTDK